MHNNAWDRDLMQIPEGGSIMWESVTALYRDRMAADLAVDILLAQGVKKKDISVLMSDATRNKKYAIEVNTKAPEGAAAGGAVGGAIGAMAMGLTAVGTVAATGGMGLVAAGPVVAALAGGGVGATAGGLVGGLIGFGFEENEAKFVDKDIENGSILITADIPNEWEQDVKNVFENTGAKKVTVH